MQNPKNRLDKAGWYSVASEAVLHATKSAYSGTLAVVPKSSLVMFLEYHSGSVRTCKVMFGEYVGWILVDKKYQDPMNFFTRVSL